VQLLPTLDRIAVNCTQPVRRRTNGGLRRLLHHDQNYQDPAPLVGWGRFHNGAPQRYVLNTAVAYAQYVLATSNRR
jgi:hypothetical protein